MKQVRHLRALQAFEVAANHRNLSHAAVAMGVTQGAVSRQIGQLEKYLSVTLFRRISNGVELTEIGQRLHTTTRQAFLTLELGIAEVRRPNNKKSLTISLPAALATKWLVTRLPQFRAKHPDIEIFLDTSGEIVDFSTSEVNVALRFSDRQVNGLFYEQISKESLVVVASPRLLKGIDQPLSAKTISEIPILDDAFDSRWKEWGEMSDQSGQLEIAPSIRFKDSAVMISAAIDGQGVALARRILVEDDIAFGRLSRLDDKEIILDRSLNFVCRARDKDYPNIRKLRVWLQASIPVSIH